MKYINADELNAKIYEEYDPSDDDYVHIGIGIVQDLLNGMPSADVVEVVRCKDCKKYKPYVYPYPCGECGNCSYDVPAKIVKEDGYCDEGERKETE